MILYFTHGEETLENGTSSLGNTEIVAHKIQIQTHESIFRLVPQRPYPTSYQELITVAKREQVEKTLPEYKPLAIDWSEEKNLILGYPIWWGALPQIVVHFLRSTNLNGKTIYPFCTHEGSRFGQSLKELQQCCPGVEIQPGLPIRGSRANKADRAIEYWLSTTKITTKEIF